MMPAVWILLSIVINCCNASTLEYSYGPYQNVRILGYGTNALQIDVPREDVPGVPSGDSMVGKWMIADGKWYKIEAHDNHQHSFYEWKISPDWPAEFNGNGWHQHTVQFVDGSECLYGPYQNVRILASDTENIKVPRVDVPDVPLERSVIGEYMIVDGVYYDVDAPWEAVNPDDEYYYWHVTPDWPAKYMDNEFHTFSVKIIYNGLQWFGWDPDRPLAMCEGDCDSDDDCFGDLQCFHNDRAEKWMPPGCFGWGYYGSDWCWAPDDVPQMEKMYEVSPWTWHGWNGETGRNYELLECQGDCNDDNDCQGSLICVHNRIPNECYQGTDYINWYRGWVTWEESMADFCANAHLNAAAVEGDDFEDPQHFKLIDAINDAVLDTAAISLTGKDLFILALLILNVVSLTILVCKCTKRFNREKVKYEAVSVLSENEG